MKKRNAENAGVAERGAESDGFPQNSGKISAPPRFDQSYKCFTVAREKIA